VAKESHARYSTKGIFPTEWDKQERIFEGKKIRVCPNMWIIRICLFL
jgi:hypothetical protein